jgi:hypothetical protein
MSVWASNQIAFNHSAGTRPVLHPGAGQVVRIEGSSHSALGCRGPFLCGQVAGNADGRRKSKRFTEESTSHSKKISLKKSDASAAAKISHHYYFW